MSAMGGRFDGLRVLDLFAGSGALGLECLSRGAEHCTFVERASASLRVLEANIRLLGAEAASRVVRQDALAFVDGIPEIAYDLAVADPPYGRGLAAEVLGRYRGRPFARELWVEHRTDEALPPLPGLRQRGYGDTTLSILVTDA
jgi:16S rRNA (guanine966-N2)-methyltransferase